MLNENELAFPVNAQFVDTFFPTIDGVVRTVHNYAKIMNQYSYSCVVVPKMAGKYTDVLPYDVFRADSFRIPFMKEYTIATPDTTKGLSKRLNRMDFQIFHAHSPFTMGQYALREARRRNIPIVATFHSKYYDDILKNTHSPLVAKQATKNIVRFYEAVDACWTVCEGSAETLRSYGCKRDIYVIDNGTDYAFPAHPEELRLAAEKRFFIPKDKPVLLFVGHQIWQKNLKLVIDTAAVLKKRGFDFLILIAGNGYAANRIREYARQKNVEGSHVRFIGQITDINLMKGIYLSCGLFFFPSVYDNSPLVLREASAMGLPTLLMKDSNAAEKVEDGVNAYLTEDDPEKTADIIIRIFKAPEHMAAVGKKAQQTISFPWESLMPTICGKYFEIIQQHRKKF